MPSTKPDLNLDEEGVCNACRSYEKRQEIDWTARRNELVSVLERYRNKEGTNWDCIIPVSGGNLPGGSNAAIWHEPTLRHCNNL